VLEPAAKAFKCNEKDCTVFTDGCNKLLYCVVEGKKTNEFNQKYPQRGEVDLLCGGQPSMLMNTPCSITPWSPVIYLMQNITDSSSIFWKT